MSIAQERPTNIFGTDGVRDRAGEGYLTPEALRRFGVAVTRFAQQGDSKAPTILMGRDPRVSGESIETHLTGAMESIGATVKHAGVIPTPGVSLLVQHGEFDLGIVISASHNPPEYNGVKVLNGRGCKLSIEQEQAITADFFAVSDVESGPGTVAVCADLKSEYQRTLLDTFRAGGDLTGMSVVLDCARGATASYAPEIFREAGADVVALFAEEDGGRINDGCGSLHPDELQRRVRAEGAHLGVAFDGDGDRAILVDDRGEIVDGDEMMTLWALDLKSRGELADNCLVSTVMSNSGMETYLRDNGVEMLRAAVGDREVFRELEVRGLTLGGEQSGHIIFHSEARTGDGIRTGLHMARIVLASGQPLSELRAPIPRYPQVLLGVEVGTKPPLDGLEQVAHAQRRAEEELGEQGRVLLRYSGTEPLARVLVEGPDPDALDRMANEIADAIRGSIGTS